MSTITIQDEIFTMVPIEGTSGFTLTRLTNLSELSRKYTTTPPRFEVTGEYFIGTDPIPESNQKPVVFKRESFNKRNENISSVIKEFAGLLDEFENSLRRLIIRHFLENSDAVQVNMPSLNIDLDKLDRIVNAPYIISTQPSPSGSSSQD